MNPFLHNPVAASVAPAGAADATAVDVAANAASAAASVTGTLGGAVVVHTPLARAMALDGATAPASVTGASAGAKALRAAWTRSVRAPEAGRRTARHWGRRLGMLALAAGMSLTAASALALDVNSATAEQLQTLRGVGPKTAAIIIHERQRGGNFQSLEDLSDRVRGIGAKKARALQEAGLSIGAGAGAATTGTGKPGAPAGAEPGAAGAEPVKPAGRSGRQGARRGSGRP